MGFAHLYLDKYNPDEYELIDMLNRYTILDYFGINDAVKEKKSHCCNVDGKATFSRVVIRRKKAKH